MLLDRKRLGKQIGYAMVFLPTILMRLVIYVIDQGSIELSVLNSLLLLFGLVFSATNYAIGKRIGIFSNGENAPGPIAAIMAEDEDSAVDIES